MTASTRAQIYCDEANNSTNIANGRNEIITVAATNNHAENQVVATPAQFPTTGATVSFSMTPKSFPFSKQLKLTKINSFTRINMQ